MEITAEKPLQKALTATRRTVHQTSFLRAFVQACVRSTTHRCCAVSGAGPQRAASCGPLDSMS